MKNEKNKVAFLSLIAAFILTSFKMAVGIMTGSLGILSEALHSGLDFIAAGITWISVRISDKPADENHHFGHGKIENLSALIETILLLITCIWIIYEAINRLANKTFEIEVNIWSYVVVIISIIIDISRSRALKRVAKKYNSQALEADALHFSTDIWSSAVVLIGLIGAGIGILIADIIAALIVAIIVVFVSIKLGKKAIDVLLDKAPKETVDKIKTIINQNEHFYSFKNLRVRASGADTFVELTVNVDSQLSMIKAHELAHLAEDAIRKEIDRCEVHIHTEPYQNS